VRRILVQFSDAQLEWFEEQKRLTGKSRSQQIREAVFGEDDAERSPGRKSGADYPGGSKGVSVHPPGDESRADGHGEAIDPSERSCVTLSDRTVRSGNRTVADLEEDRGAVGGSEQKPRDNEGRAAQSAPAVGHEKSRQRERIDRGPGSRRPVGGSTGRGNGFAATIGDDSGHRDENRINVGGDGPTDAHLIEAHSPVTRKTSLKKTCGCSPQFVKMGVHIADCPKRQST